MIRDTGSHAQSARSPGPDADSEGLPPTQRLSQVRGFEKSRLCLADYQ